MMTNGTQALRGRAAVRIPGGMTVLCILFTVFCMFPFILPNPILKSDLQPYAAVIGTLVLLFRFNFLINDSHYKKALQITGITLFIALIIFILSGITMNGMRALYNYYSVFVIPCATLITLNELGGLPEKTVKFCIIVWFLVGSIQFFVSRSFALAYVSNASQRIGMLNRGVCGLASEPSFFGIACFYLLHLVSKFKKHQLLFMLIVVLMGSVYAQSLMGLLFIAVYWAVTLLDRTRTRKGIYIWIASIVLVVFLLYYMVNRLNGSRLYSLLVQLRSEGFSVATSDTSAAIRLNSIFSSLRSAAGNLFLPQGFHARIGSGFGGFLVEMGLFAIPTILLITYSLSLTHTKKFCRVLYFILVLLLHFNNTQIGNPILLYAAGLNMYYFKMAAPEDVSVQSAPATL